MRNIVVYGNNLQMLGKVLYYFAFAYVTIYPISVFFFFLMAGSKGLQNETLKRYIGALYSGIDTSNAANSQYVTLFLIRRACIGASISFSRSHYFLQLELFMITSFACLCFLCLMKPYKSKLHNAIEICNEILVMLSVYMMHGFCLYIPSRDWKYRMGWIYVGILVAVLIINILLMLRHIATFVYEKIKLIKSSKMTLS